MTTNFFFSNFENSMEQNLIEDLIVESIKIYGHDLFYIPRNVDTTKAGFDDLRNETDLASFDENYMVEMYVKNVDGFEGNGEFLSKFGLEVRDQITFSIAMKTFDLEVTQHSAHNHAYDDAETMFSHTLFRPREGDLVYFPLNRKVFEIQKVNHESIFYQMGTLQMYDLQCELFEYSGEHFNTGIPYVDEFYASIDIDKNDTLEATEMNSEWADNFTIETEADKIIDFDEKDPFSFTGDW